MERIVLNYILMEMMKFLNLFYTAEGDSVKILKIFLWVTESYLVMTLKGKNSNLLFIRLQVS